MEVINLWHAFTRGLVYCTWVVCLALFYFVLSTNDAAYPVDNEAENLCVILSETAHLLQSLSPTQDLYV